MATRPGRHRELHGAAHDRVVTAVPPDLENEALRRERWLVASAEITRTLLADHGAEDGTESLRLVASRARELADAELVAVVLPAGASGRLMVELAEGEHAESLIGLGYPAAGSLVGEVLADGRPVLADSHQTLYLPPGASLGPVMVIPLRGSGSPRGALVVARGPGAPAFEPADLAMASGFADQAAVVLELTEARAEQQRVSALVDRDRAARDLQDLAIQRLFAAGLTVQSVARGLSDDPRGERLSSVVAEIDDTIRQIRELLDHGPA